MDATRRNFIVGPIGVTHSFKSVDTMKLQLEGDFFKGYLALQKTGDIRITHVDPEIFDALCRYSNDPDKFVARKLSIDQLIEMAVAADYFIMDNLLKKVKNLLRCRIRAGNVWSVLNELYVYPTIVDVCNKTLTEKSHQCIQEINRKKISMESWLYFLQLSHLTVSEEVDLIKATLKISRHNYFDKTWLSASLPYLRLLTLENKNHLKYLISFGKTISTQAREALEWKVTNNSADGPWKDIFKLPKYCPIQEKRVPKSGIISFEWKNSRRPYSTLPNATIEYLFSSIAAIKITGLQFALEGNFSCDCKIRKKHKYECSIQKHVRQIVQITQKIYCANQNSFATTSQTLWVNGLNFTILKSSECEANIKFSKPLQVDANQLLEISFSCNFSQKSSTPCLQPNKLHPLKQLPCRSTYGGKNADVNCVIALENFLCHETRLDGLFYTAL